MQIHQLHPRYTHKKRKRIGRGGKRGTYSGRGLKGQKARSGRILESLTRALIKRYPKLRGYRAEIRQYAVVAVNLKDISKHFDSKTVITPKVLFEKKIIRMIGGKIPAVKILGAGKLDHPLSFADCVISASAKTKIEKAGGTIKSPAVHTSP